MRSLATHRLVVATALICSWHSACGQSPEKTLQPDVLLVSIDSLRADHLGCYGYLRDTSPRLDQLADEGVRFDTVVSTTSWTLPAHAALFTGLFDPAHGTTDVDRRLADGYDTLAERFRAAGWITAGFYAGPLLHPTFGLNQGFNSWISCMSTPASTLDDHSDLETLFEANTSSHADVTGPRTLEAVQSFLEAGHDGALFLFVHLWDPHYDYIPPAPYDRFFDPDYTGSLDVRAYPFNDSVHAEMDRRDLGHVIALYDGEIRFTDTTLAKLLELLDQARPERPRLTIVTADHGEEFFEHGGKGHQQTLFEESIRVPLLLHWPGKLPAGRVVSGPASLVDVAPTVLSLVGIDTPARFQGIDLTSAIRGQAVPSRGLHQLLEVGGRRIEALRTKHHKLMLADGLVAHVNLETDPRELDLRPGPPPDDSSLAPLLEAILADSRSLRTAFGGDNAEARRIDPALAERLRALGYVQ